MASEHFEASRDQVLAELRGCQERTLQTLVPTIISVGLIAIADRENFAMITLVSSFAVLFGSSLYIASLAYKIFRNGSYIQALNELDPNSAAHSWGAALNKFHELSKPPGVIGYETTTIAVVYFIFSGAFVLMFFEMNAWLSLVLGTVLAGVALQIYLIPKVGKGYLEHWRDVLRKIEIEGRDET